MIGTMHTDRHKGIMLENLGNFDGNWYSSQNNKQVY